MKKERTSAQVVVEDVMKIKKNERVLIIANPATTQIAQDLYSASEEKGAFPVLIFQPNRTSFDNAMPEVLASIKTTRYSPYSPFWADATTSHLTTQ